MLNSSLQTRERKNKTGSVYFTQLKDLTNLIKTDDPLKRIKHHKLIHIVHINTAIRPDLSSCSHGHLENVVTASGPGSFPDLTQGWYRSPLPKVVPNRRLIKPLPLVEEPGDVIVGVFQEGAVNQEANPLREKIQKTPFSLKTWRRQPEADWFSPSWGPC